MFFAYAMHFAETQLFLFNHDAFPSIKSIWTETLRPIITIGSLNIWLFRCQNVQMTWLDPTV